MTLDHLNRVSDSWICVVCDRHFNLNSYLCVCEIRACGFWLVLFVLVLSIDGPFVRISLVSWPVVEFYMGVLDHLTLEHGLLFCFRWHPTTNFSPDHAWSGGCLSIMAGIGVSVNVIHWSTLLFLFIMINYGRSGVCCLCLFYWFGDLSHMMLVLLDATSLVYVLVWTSSELIYWSYFVFWCLIVPKVDGKILPLEIVFQFIFCYMILLNNRLRWLLTAWMMLATLEYVLVFIPFWILPLIVHGRGVVCLAWLRIVVQKELHDVWRSASCL